MAIFSLGEGSLRNGKRRYASLSKNTPRRIINTSIKSAAEGLALLEDNGAPMEQPGLVNINGKDLGYADVRIVEGDLRITNLLDQATLFSSTEDTHSAWLIVKGSLTVDAGVVLTPSVRKLFTVVYATGNITGPGEISMTCRGANHSGEGDSGGFTQEQDILIAEGNYAGIVDPIVPANGGAGSDTNGGLAGSPGSNGSTGGGGGGNRVVIVDARKEGAGRAGTCFSGGSGGGSAYVRDSSLDSYLAARPQYPIDAGIRGGAGGFALTDHYGVGAGEGNLGGSYILSDAANTSPYGGRIAESDPELTNPLVGGTGGTVFVISGGSVSSVSVTANAPGGANASVVNGGGAGGGSVNIVAPSILNSTAQAASITGDPFTRRDMAGYSGGMGSARILMPTAAPVISGTPTISQTGLKVGDTLIAVSGDSTSSPIGDTTWEWLFDGVDAGDGSGAYTLTENEAGKTLVLRQIETNLEGSDTADSAPLAIDALAALVIGSAPVVALGTHSNVLETTPGAVTGNPEPQVLWSWEESADGVSGWSAVADEATKFLEARGSRAGKFFRITQTATNSQGVATSTSAAVELVAARDTLDLVTSDVLAFSMNRRLRAGVTSPYRAIETLNKVLTEEMAFDSEGVTDTSVLAGFVSGAGATEAGLDAWYDQSANPNGVDLDSYQLSFPGFVYRQGAVEVSTGFHCADMNHNGYRYLRPTAGWNTRPVGEGVFIGLFVRSGSDTNFNFPASTSADVSNFKATSQALAGRTIDINGRRGVVVPTDTAQEAWNAIPDTGIVLMTIRGLNYQDAGWLDPSIGSWRQASYDGYAHVFEQVYLVDPTETEILAIERSMAAFYGITDYEG